MTQPVTHTPTTTRTVAEVLIGSLENARQGKADVVLTASLGQSVSISNGFTQFSMPGSSDWLANPANDADSIACNKTHDQSGEAQRPIDELLWTLGYYSFNGSLSFGCRRDDVVKMVRWPNYTRLPHDSSFHRISALLTSRPTSIVLASKLLNIPEEEVYRFYNAARYAGYVKAINRPDSEIPTPRKHKHQSLIQRLFKHMSRSS